MEVIAHAPATRLEPAFFERFKKQQSTNLSFRGIPKIMQTVRRTCQSRKYALIHP
jgi:hypothetical protein